MRTGMRDWEWALLTAAAMVLLASRQARRRASWGWAALGVAARVVLPTRPLRQFFWPAARARRGAQPGAITLTERVTIEKSAESLFEFWRDVRNLPHVLSRLEHVEALDHGRSRWTVRGPSGNRVTWDAVLMRETPARFLQWTSVPDSTLAVMGSVRFRPVSKDVTEVEVSLDCQPSSAASDAAWVWLGGSSPSLLLEHELARFKQVVETGAAEEDVEPAWLSHWIEPYARPRLVH